MNGDLIEYKQMPTIGNGYCVVVVNSFVRADIDEVTGPFLIYHHTNIPPLQIEDIACGNSFAGIGYSCFLEVTTNIDTFKRYILKINFLYSG